MKPLPPLTFNSAKLKVERANQHIAELNAVLRGFFQTKPYRIVSEFDEGLGVFSLRVRTTGIFPPEGGIIIGDVVHNLRSALEHVASDLLAAALGEEARSRSNFPMHETRDNLVDMINKGEIHANFPEVSAVILDIIKPFKGGNDLLWLIGKLWNIDKHRLPIASYGVIEITGIDAEDTRDNRVIGASVTVDHGRVVGIIGTDIPMTVTKQGETAYAVEFDEPGLLKGNPVLPTLAQMSQLTSQAIDVIEQAYYRSQARRANRPSALNSKQF